MKDGNKKKAALLGMAHGTAAGRLRKLVLFSLVTKLGENFCYRCGGEIITTSDLSIEHKQAWMSAEDPVETFFDLDNIAFSHLSCNIGAAHQPLKQTAEVRKQKRRKKDKHRWEARGSEGRVAYRRAVYERTGK